MFFIFCCGCGKQIAANAPFGKCPLCYEQIIISDERLLRMYTYESDSNLKSIALAFCTLEPELGYPPIVGLTQWAIESGWGKKVTGDFNFWGIKRYPDKGPAKLCPTWEDLFPAGFAAMRSDEKATLTKTEPLTGGLYRYHMSCWFASFSSFEEGVRGYINFILGNSRYHAAWTQYQLTKDPDAFLHGIARAGYATGKGYEDLLLTVEHQENIRHAVEMARKELGQAC